MKNIEEESNDVNEELIQPSVDGELIKCEYFIEIKGNQMTLFHELGDSYFTKQ